MTTAAATLLALAGLFAVGDWISRVRDDRRLEYVCKPATLILLTAVAVAIEPESTAMRAWFVAALVLSLAGDVFLMLPTDRFVLGLGAFLLGHVAYVGGFVAGGLEPLGVALGAGAVVLVVGPVGLRIVRGARERDAALALPVTVYITVISVMVACAAGSGLPVAFAGAALFAFSDSLIGWTRFVAPIRHSSVAIMVTYHLGQALLVGSLLT